MIGALPDPILELHDATGALLETNDNWIDSPNMQQIIDTGIAPTDPAESAIVGHLPANNDQLYRGCERSEQYYWCRLVEAYRPGYDG